MPLLLVITLGASCGYLKPDDRAPTPTQRCLTCCAYAQDACKLDTDNYPMARCPPKHQECVQACETGDENEMCVVQTNRELARLGPPARALPPIVATASAKPLLATTSQAAPASARPDARGACDAEGTWVVALASAVGEGRGCTGVDEIPREVSFRIERHDAEYRLRDLLPAPGWHDAFSVENGADACVVTIRRDNFSDGTRPRALEVRLTSHDGHVAGAMHYEEKSGEATRPIACALAAAAAGQVVAPAARPTLPAPPAPLPMPLSPPSPRILQHGEAVGRSCTDALKPK